LNQTSIELAEENGRKPVKRCPRTIQHLRLESLNVGLDQIQCFQRQLANNLVEGPHRNRLPGRADNASRMSPAGTLVKVDPQAGAAFVPRSCGNDHDIVSDGKIQPQRLPQSHEVLCHRLEGHHCSGFAHQPRGNTGVCAVVGPYKVGIKVFNRQTLRDTILHTHESGFAFDLELLTVAHKLGHHKIIEAPVTITHHFSSTVSWRSALQMLRSTMRIHRRASMAFGPLAPERHEISLTEPEAPTGSRYGLVS